MANSEIVWVKDLTKVFGDFIAVNNISLSVKKGEIFGFFILASGIGLFIWIGNGFITEIVTADIGVTQFTNLRIESGIVNCPRSLIILTAFILSEYQKIRKCQEIGYTLE